MLPIASKSCKREETNCRQIRFSEVRSARVLPPRTPGGQCRRERDHEGRDRYRREKNCKKGLADLELIDDAVEDVADAPGLVQGEVVDVDVQEHEACPRCGELDSHRDPLVFQCGGGLTCSHHLSPSFERWIRLAESNLDIAAPANAPQCRCYRGCLH